MCKVPGTGDEYPSFAEIGDEIKSVDEKVLTKEIRETGDHAHPGACFSYTLYRIQSCENQVLQLLLTNWCSISLLDTQFRLLSDFTPLWMKQEFEGQTRAQRQGGFRD
jgi:hypothetical protein